MKCRTTGTLYHCTANNAVEGFVCFSEGIKIITENKKKACLMDLAYFISLSIKNQLTCIQS
jgi:hypothetical protein